MLLRLTGSALKVGKGFHIELANYARHRTRWGCTTHHHVASSAQGAPQMAQPGNTLATHRRAQRRRDQSPPTDTANAIYSRRFAVTPGFNLMEDHGNRRGKWCPGAGSNHRHCDFQSHALPTELPGRRRAGGRARAVYSQSGRPCPPGKPPEVETGITSSTTCGNPHFSRDGNSRAVAGKPPIRRLPRRWDGPERHRIRTASD